MGVHVLRIVGFQPEGHRVAVFHVLVQIFAGDKDQLLQPSRAEGPVSLLGLKLPSPVDADPEDPADFGEEVLVTDALRSAAKRTASIGYSRDENRCLSLYLKYS